MLKRVFDVGVSIFLLVVLSPVFSACALAVRFSSPGPVIFKSRRIARGGAVFEMLKFRTMREGAPQVATHLLANPEDLVTPVGKFLRRSSLDELPQLWNVLRGDMSLVGPRPALFNQEDLIALRRRSGVEALRPGITGWAQVCGRDGISTEEKATLDAEYLRKRTFLFDLRILFLTVFKVLQSEGIQH
jgi:O-antigen biosynthesis protein WbqP